MAHAYTPGLRVVARTTLRKERRLPIAGAVLARLGDRVRAEDVVARADLPGPVVPVNVVNQLGIAVRDLPGCMLKQAGDPVAEGELIAATRPLIKLFRSTAASPLAGVLETVSDVTGQVIVRGPPQPLNLRAYVDGTVVAVREHEGVVVETSGALVQGILGVGGEVAGALDVLVDRPDAVADPARLDASHAGKVVVAGAFIGAALFRRASELGVAALIGGGLDDSDLRALLGRDLGVAITGHEEIRPILIVTEGFGRIPMARATYALLRERVGRRASASGATQIRAGVLRPEIIVPDDAGVPGGHAPAAEAEPHGLAPGSRVRIIREPWFGVLGVVADLPPGLAAMPSEIRVRVAVVRADDGRDLTVPRSNLEAIEE